MEHVGEDNSKTPQPFQSYSCHIVVSIASLPAPKVVDREIGSQTLSDTLTSGTTPSQKRNTQDLFLRRFLHESFLLTFMGKKSKGGKTDAKVVKQAAKPSQKEKDRQSKEEKAAQ